MNYTPSTWFRSIKEFVKKYQEGNKALDVLVNNASIFIGEDATTEDGLEVWPCLMLPITCLQSELVSTLAWSVHIGLACSVGRMTWIAMQDKTDLTTGLALAGHHANKLPWANGSHATADA